MNESAGSIFDYCERQSDGFWAEPVNAITNLAFIIAALLLIRQLARLHIPPLKALDIVLLNVLLVAIGVGSFLWHSLARPWTEWADVIPILLFISLYLLSFLFRVVGLNIVWVLFWFALYHVFNSGLQAYLPADTLNGSIFYLPTLLVLILIGLYSRHIQHPSANRLLLAGILFVISILFRTIDMTFCSVWPVGTHFIWHIINAFVLYTLTMGLVVAIRLDKR